MIVGLSLSFIRACFGFVSWGEGFRHLWGVGLSYFLISMLHHQKRWEPWPSSSILPARKNSAEDTYTCSKSSGQWTGPRDRLFHFSRSWLLGERVAPVWACFLYQWALTGSWLTETPLCEDILGMWTSYFPGDSRVLGC